MNAAARLYNQDVVSRKWIISVLMTKFQMSMTIMILAILTSGFSIVYITNATRSLHASIQQGFAERDHLSIEWGQLLLERGTYIMQARIQKIAEEKLGMIIPDNKSIIIISGK